jgi:hypothetical protein
MGTRRCLLLQFAVFRTRAFFASNHEPSIEAHICPFRRIQWPFRVAYERKVEADIILSLHTSLGPVQRVRVGDLDESGGSACQASALGMRAPCARHAVTRRGVLDAG